MSSESTSRSGEPDVARPRRTRSTILWVMAIVATAALTWWAASVALTPPRVEAGARQRTIVTVTEATIGSSLSVGVTLSQPVVAESTNLLSGVVTAVARGRTLKEGAAAYSVAGVPVVVVQGDSPFYRELSTGVEGKDVRILQQALSRLGYFQGAADGRFGAATRLAVIAWQRDRGEPGDGVVRLGQIVAIPALPIPVRLGPAIRVGALLSGGEDGILGPTGKRTFQITLSPDRFAQIPTSAHFAVHYKNRTWDAVAANTTVDDNQNVIIELAGTSGGEVCARQCGELPTDEKYTLRGEALIAPTVSGPAVAAAAIRTDSAGRAYVMLASGGKRSVTVKGSQGGVAVVEGLSIGDKVVLPDGAAAAGSASDPTPPTS